MDVDAEGYFVIVLWHIDNPFVGVSMRLLSPTRNYRLFGDMSFESVHIRVSPIGNYDDVTQC